MILQVTDPDGKSLGKVDTGTCPEVLAAKLAKAGAYTITVTGFRGATGDFTVDVRPVLSPSKTTTDFNLLVFDDVKNRKECQEGLFVNDLYGEHRRLLPGDCLDWADWQAR